MFRSIILSTLASLLLIACNPQEKNDPKAKSDKIQKRCKCDVAYTFLFCNSDKNSPPLGGNNISQYEATTMSVTNTQWIVKKNEDCSYEVVKGIVGDCQVLLPPGLKPGTRVPDSDC